ncbi:MAG: nucleoside hydrolase [Planctomycetes bacterium]|nr:nucleoside hydrolase [Planctomycetota bacterium]
MRLILSLLALSACSVPARAADRVPVVIDTDIGSDVDDAFALALAVASPEIDLVGVTTVGSAADDRAWLVCRFLTQITGKKKAEELPPVAIGGAPPEKTEIDWQIQYRRHPAAIFNRTLKPSKEPAPDLLAKLAKAHDGKLVVVCLGPLTNILKFIETHPDAAKKVKRFVVMGGSVAVGYDGAAKPEPEWNVKCDTGAAKQVFAAGLPLTVIPLDATATVKLDKAAREKLFGARTMLTYQIQNLYELWDKEAPVLFDPVAVAAVFEEKHLTFKEMNLQVHNTGNTQVGGGKPNCRVATAIKADEFVKWYVERVRAFGTETLPEKPKHAAKLIDPGAFPAKVHVAEDYDTDIEKRWWMCGKGETKDVRPGGVRGQRAVLTQDFDDRQGNMKTMDRAVIFNPVPGPPMGANTRLRFRYKLTATDTIRVQLYSLTNGYHRYLSVSGLEQGKWLDGCVDMTQMRRPDGTGGALAADERIDDIQFYIDPRAELLIDDVILYEAAAAGETRPFPKRVIFSAWFDTGAQGKEWPGAFQIVPHEKPRTWKFAKSVKGDNDEQVIRVGMRGTRKLDAATELTFKYKLAGADGVAVELRDKGKVVATRKLALTADKWGDSAATFKLTGKETADEIVFRAEKGAELSVDDVLLFVP